MQRNAPVRSMRTIFGTVTTAALLAAVGAAVSHVVAAPVESVEVTPNPTAYTQTLQHFPFREYVSPDGRGGYTTVIEQVAKVVSISDSTLTAASSDGTVKTYVITPRTTAVTLAAGRNRATQERFSVDEVVFIVGTVEDGTAFATVVADQAATNGNGPPMDGDGG